MRSSDLPKSTSVATRWLRPGTVVVVALAHAAVIFAVPWPKAQDLVVPVTLQIDVIAGGEPAYALSPHAGEEVAESKPSEAQAGEVAPVETQAVEVLPPVVPVVPREVAEAKPPPEAPVPPPAVAPAASPPVIASIEPHPEAPPVAERPPPPPDTLRRKAEEAERSKEQADARKRAAAAAAARLASRAGTDTGHGEAGAADSGAEAASYRALIAAEIRRHQNYPQSAAGASGTVVVVFTIGASGRVVASSVIRSSGNNAFDVAAREMLAAVALPPPPGGRFAVGATPIHFSMR